MTSKLYLVGALALALAACSDATQIVLAIDTTAGIPCDIDRIRVRAVGSEASTFEQDLADVRLPLTVKLSDETSSGTFMLEVTGLKGGVEVLRAAGPLQFGNGGNLAEHVVLESSCTVDAPCDLDPLTADVGPPPPVSARFQCGANVRRYKVGPTVETFRDACTVPGANAGKVLIDGTRGAAKLNIPEAALEAFDFRFYSQPIRQIWAHEDGYISFAPNNPDARNDLDPGAFDRDLLATGVPPPPKSIMAFWDGLTLSTTGVCYALEGPDGTQKLRVTWSKTCQTQVCTSDSLNFTIVLDERTQKVALTYGDMIGANASRAQGGTATVGIVNDAKGCPVSQCSIDTGLCSDGRTPCGYTQVFSNMAQAPRVKDIEFTPQIDAQ